MILNIGLKPLTPSQKEAGGKDFTGVHRDKLTKLFTFHGVPSVAEVRDRSRELLKLLDRYPNKEVCIDSVPPFAMEIVKLTLLNNLYTPLYSWEETQASTDKRKKPKKVHGKWLHASNLKVRV